MSCATVIFSMIAVSCVERWPKSVVKAASKSALRATIAHLSLAKSARRCLREGAPSRRKAWRWRARQSDNGNAVMVRDVFMVLVLIKGAEEPSISYARTFWQVAPAYETWGNTDVRARRGARGAVEMSPGLSFSIFIGTPL